jgi:hypothetical protein
MGKYLGKMRHKCYCSTKSCCMFLEVQSREESFLQQHSELLPRRDYLRSRPIQRDNTTMSMHQGRKPFGQKQYFHLDNSIELEQG